MQQPSLVEQDVAILKLCQKTSEEPPGTLAGKSQQKHGGVWVSMIRQRLGLDRSKNHPATEQSHTLENSCGSLGLSTERDLIGNLLTPDEPSIEDELLRKLPTDPLAPTSSNVLLKPASSNEQRVLATSGK